MGVVGMVTAEAVMATDVALRQDAQVDLHVAAALRHAAVVDLHAVAVDAANPLTSKLRPRPLQLTDWWGLSLVGIWLRRENQNNRR
jgi:hypothetical protein